MIGVRTTSEEETRQESSLVMECTDTRSSGDSRLAVYMRDTLSLRTPRRTKMFEDGRSGFHTRRLFRRQRWNAALQIAIFQAVYTLRTENCIG